MSGGGPKCQISGRSQGPGKAHRQKSEATSRVWHRICHLAEISDVTGPISDITQRFSDIIARAVDINHRGGDIAARCGSELGMSLILPLSPWPM